MIHFIMFVFFNVGLAPDTMPSGNFLNVKVVLPLVVIESLVGITLLLSELFASQLSSDSIPLICVFEFPASPVVSVIVGISAGKLSLSFFVDKVDFVW